MAQNHFLAGVGTALLFKGNDLVGVAKTLTESTFDFAITAEDIRGGQGNGLLGRYFHDSTLTATLTDAMFDLNYMALSLGVNIESGGLSVKEEELTATAGVVTVTETPVAFAGTMIGWYKKPTDSDWQIGTIAGTTMTITGATAGQVYCVKYFYQNENAKSITIKSQYVPATLHVVVMTDLYSGKVGTQSDATRYGRLIVDIPQFQLEGNLIYIFQQIKQICINMNIIVIKGDFSATHHHCLKVNINFFEVFNNFGYRAIVLPTFRRCRIVDRNIVTL
jgi:hypothetical protein